MSEFIGDWHALAVLLIAGVFPNQIWRMLGLWLGSGIDEGSELLVWVRAVATAVLAGVIAQILVQPPGALASVPGLAALCRAGRGLRRFLHDAAVDLCRRGLRRGGDVGRQMVAWLIRPSPPRFAIAADPQSATLRQNGLLGKRHELASKVDPDRLSCDRWVVGNSPRQRSGVSDTANQGRCSLSAGRTHRHPWPGGG
jgi:hypothetical protein